MSFKLLLGRQTRAFDLVFTARGVGDLLRRSRVGDIMLNSIMLNGI
jgi:hypothetical protein